MFSSFLPSAAIAPVSAFFQSDLFGKIIVILLICISMYVWIVMLEKGSSLRKARRLNRQFTDQFREARHLLQLVVSQTPEAPLKEVYHSGIIKLMYLCGENEASAEQLCRQGRMPRALTPIESEIVVDSADHTMALEGLKLEDRLSNLATIVSVSPFFGLLGTVWGVMLSFTDMAEQGSASITTLAPGISGALLTTVVGLLVAIPSLIGYNYLTNTVRQINVDMENFLSEFEARLKTEATYHGPHQ